MHKFTQIHASLLTGSATNNNVFYYSRRQLFFGFTSEKHERQFRKRTLPCSSFAEMRKRSKYAENRRCFWSLTSNAYWRKILKGIVKIVCSLARLWAKWCVVFFYAKTFGFFNSFVCFIRAFLFYKACLLRCKTTALLQSIFIKSYYHVK